MSDQVLRSPSGYEVRMGKNHHLMKPVFIGEVQRNGQLKIVWRTDAAVVSAPRSPFLPENRTGSSE